MAIAPSGPDPRHLFTAPDGSRIAVDGPGLAGDDRWSCLFVARIYGSGHPFTVCRRGTAEALAAALRMTDVRIGPYRNADVLLAYDSTGFDASEHGETTAAWRGPWHELHTARTGPPMGTESFTRLFDAFLLTDTPDGLLVRPRSPRNVAFEPFTVFVQVPGIGDLQIQRPHEAHTTLPRWRGAPARGGEIWRRRLTGEDGRGRARQETLILATVSAVSELFPGPLDTRDGDLAATFLSDVDVSWTPA